MSEEELLERFERLARASRAIPPQDIHAAPGVMRRIRIAETQSREALAFIALGSFVTAVAVCVFGLAHFSEVADPLEALLQLVPPIGL